MIVDTQSVKNTATSTQEVGFDGGKQTKGRKRLFVIDTLGNLLASLVVAANRHDGEIATTYWAELVRQYPLLAEIKKVYVEGTFNGRFREHLAKRYQIPVEVPRQVVRQQGKFCIHATRWKVERTIAWTSNNRRLSKEYERKTVHSNAFMMIANIRRAVKYA